MRISCRIALGTAALAAMPVSAALPPQHQRAAELRALIDHAGVVGAFDGAPIDRIELVRPDLYRVTAGRCRLDVRIVDLPTPRDVAGPRRFEVRPGGSVCDGAGGRR
jgi:hypothetical protein